MADVAPCVKAFILFFLCGNPILRGAFVTLLNTVIARLSLEIDLLTLQIARLNIINQITSAGISALNGLINQVKVDLNLIIGPLQQAHDCLPLANLNATLQDTAVGRTFSAVYKKLYEINRVTNLIQVQNSIKQQKEEQVRRLQDMLNAITSLCP